MASRRWERRECAGILSMALQISTQEFNLIRDYLHDQCGIFINDNKKYFLESRLAGIVADYGCSSFGDLYRKLKNISSFNALFQRLMDEITTNETLWFRDQKPFQIWSDHLLPLFSEALLLGASEDITVWSAACSTGQEPYSIAMSALNYFNARNSVSMDKMRIIATDVSANAVATAKTGRYDRLAMSRGLPESYIDAYFSKEDDFWVVKDKVKRMITFKQFNLKDPIAGLAAPFDVIFLRNVVIYFSDRFKRQLFERIFRALKPGGYLILGAGESVASFPDAFKMMTYDGVVYYQRK